MSLSDLVSEDYSGEPMRVIFTLTTEHLQSEKRIGIWTYTANIPNTVIPEIDAIFYKYEHCEAFYTCIAQKLYSFMDTITGIIISVVLVRII